MPDFTMADILGAQFGAPGPVYEGGPTGNVRYADVLGALGLGGPSWLDRAQQQTAADIGAYQSGGVPALMADRGETADLAGGFAGTTTPKGIRAYHGSPHDFPPHADNPLGKFDLSRIGTGEGAQAYGHGLYFAESPAVAEEYKKSLSVKALEDFYRQLTETGRADRPTPPVGKMYEVNINAKPEQFLDWDKQYAAQPQAVKDIVAQYGNQAYYHPATSSFNPFSGAEFPPATGAEYYQGLASKIGPRPQVSEALKEAGIPGIKYLDQGSRMAPIESIPTWENFLAQKEAGKTSLDFVDWMKAETANQRKNIGTSNYVVFNPDIIDIRKKWALLLAAMGGGGAPTMGSVLQSQSEPQQ